MKYKPFCSGDIYNGLVLTGKSYNNENGRCYVEFICTCGKTKFSAKTYIMTGRVRSCGCILDSYNNKKGTHRMSGTGKWHPIYRAYVNMKQRCYNPKTDRYSSYGGRGIIVCDLWKNDFIPFKEWAEQNGWEPGLTLDRKEVNGIYEPSNCRWVTMDVQRNNKTTTVYLTAFNEKKCVSEWVKDERCVVTGGAIRHRIRKLGWAVERAISEKPLNNLK